MDGLGLSSSMTWFAKARSAIEGQMQKHEAVDQEDGPESDDISGAFGASVRTLREEAGMTLQDLSSRSGVSRAMLSKVERGEKSPTIGIAASIAKALNTSLTYLTSGQEERSAVAVVRRKERHIFKDRKTGFERHVLTPPIAGISTELLYHFLPAGKSTGRLPPYPPGTEKHIVVVNGALVVEMRSGDISLESGDSVFFEANVEHAFVNRTELPCDYYLVVARRPRN